MVQTIRPITGDVKIFVPIVVIIRNRRAHAIARALEARFLRNVFKCSVRFLVIHAIPVLRSGLLRNKTRRSGIGVGRAVHQEQIQPAIVIAIEKRNPGAHRLQQILARRMQSLVLKMHPRLFRDINEARRDHGRR